MDAYLDLLEDRIAALENTCGDGNNKDDLFSLTNELDGKVNTILYKQPMLRQLIADANRGNLWHILDTIWTPESTSLYELDMENGQDNGEDRKISIEDKVAIVNSNLQEISEFANGLLQLSKLEFPDPTMSATLAASYPEELLTKVNDTLSEQELLAIRSAQVELAWLQNILVPDCQQWASIDAVARSRLISERAARQQQLEEY